MDFLTGGWTLGGIKFLPKKINTTGSIGHPGTPEHQVQMQTLKQSKN